MIRRPRAGPVPMELALGFLDRKVVDAGKTPAHQTIVIELPVLVPIGAEPVAGIVVKLICKAYGYPIVGERPQLLDQAVVELPVPLACEKGDYGLTAVDELRSVSPVAIDCVGQGDTFRVARVPAILRRSHFLDGGAMGEG